MVAAPASSSAANLLKLPDMVRLPFLKELPSSGSLHLMIGRIEMAPDLAPFDLIGRRRRAHAADIHRLRAARVERAAGGNALRARRLAAERRAGYSRIGCHLRDRRRQ